MFAIIMLPYSAIVEIAQLCLYQWLYYLHSKRKQEELKKWEGHENLN